MCPIYRPHGLSTAASSVEARAHLRHLLRLEKRDGFPWNRAKEETISLIKAFITPRRRLEEREYPPSETREGRISPSINAREVILTPKKE